MLDAAVAGLTLVVQWPAIGYLLLGVLVGLYFGAMPGLSGLVGLAILLPFTFGMDPISAFALLLGMFAVTTTSDTIASVLLGIPGTVSSQATVLDGYPMAVRGEAERAFGAAFTVSALGGVIGALVLGLSIPVVRPLILSFASPEFFLLGVLGLTMVGSLSGGSILKGILAAAFGLMLSMVGYAEMGGIARFHLGFTYLLDGVPLIPLVLGLFAVPELLELAVRGGSISRVPRARTPGGRIRGVRDAIRHRWLVLRCSAIGIYVGMLPGLGGTVVDWVAYGHAVQNAKDKKGFGKGDVRGVIAPEAANNAMKGGALLPTVAFGIPGSAPMALILGALTIQGLTPGPQMLTNDLYVTFSLVWILVIANLIGAGALFLATNQLARVTFINGHLIIPAIVIFIFMGSWMTSNAIGDWISLIAFGCLGYVMKQGGLPRPPLILGFILGPIMENALFISNQAYGPIIWFMRPVCMALVLMVAATVAYSIRARRRENVKTQLSLSTKKDEGEEDLFLSFSLALLGTIGITFAAISAMNWPADAAMFPLVVATLGAILGVATMCSDAATARRMMSTVGLFAAWRRSSSTVRDSSEVGQFILLLIGILLLTLLVGQLVALPVFVFYYLRFWGQFSWRFCSTYALFAWLFIFIMFDRVVHVLWYSPLLVR